MHIIQFWRIFWARRILILATTLSCLAGGMVLTALLPPRYESTARVMLGLLKPDPLSGQMLSGASAGAYAATQKALITDYVVASKVADSLGWFSDPDMIERYQKRGGKDRRDFAHWAAQMVIDSTDVKLLEGSNILEITYTATDPRIAKAVTEVLQKAYLDTSVAMKRDDATRQAEWFEQQADKARTLLSSAEEAKAQYEKANGVFMQDDKQDLETARLQMLAQQGVPTGSAAPMPVQTTQSSLELAQIDSVIAQQSKVLGPNHPELQALKERRSVLAGLVAKDMAAQRAANAAIANVGASNASALRRALEQQKNQVIAQSDKLGRLRQLQTEVNLRRDQFDKASTNAASFREQAAVVNTGLSPLGPPSTPAGPSFPKPMLIIPGCMALGLGFGILLSLLLEFLARRVRGAEDMKALDIPLLTVVPSAPKLASEQNNRRFLPRFGRGPHRPALASS